MPARRRAAAVPAPASPQDAAVARIPRPSQWSQHAAVVGVRWPLPAHRCTAALPPATAYPGVDRSLSAPRQRHRPAARRGCAAATTGMMAGSSKGTRIRSHVPIIVRGGRVLSRPATARPVCACPNLPKSGKVSRWPVIIWSQYRNIATAAPVENSQCGASAINLTGGPENRTAADPRQRGSPTIGEGPGVLGLRWR